MIEYFEHDRKQLNRKSSKGNQLKFERGQIWVKADYLGYEGLAEFVVSGLLSCSSLQETEFVRYELEEISYNGTIFRACKSNDFTNGWQVITLERLFMQKYGYGLNRLVYAIEDHTERLRTLVNQVEQLTGLHEFGTYMSKLLTIDTFFLNEDRHSHNLAVLTDGQNRFRLCPIFDNAAGLLSDTTLDYPMNQDVLIQMKKARPKTFCDDFDEQLDIVESLFGSQIRFRFSWQEIQSLLTQAEIYPPEIRQRVCDILMQQRRKYRYLFEPAVDS